MADMVHAAVTSGINQGHNINIRVQSSIFPWFGFKYIYHFENVESVYLPYTKSLERE